MMMLPDYTVLDPSLERLPPAELHALQAERLRQMVAYVYDATPFWRRKLDAAGVTPGDVSGLDDLSRLPFCTKEELQTDQAEHPPFGSYIGVDRAHRRPDVMACVAGDAPGTFGCADVDLCTHNFRPLIPSS